MKTKIFCENTEHGWHLFYIEDDGREYYLFRQRYHRGVGDFFSSGVSLNKAMDFTKCHKDTAIARTMAKIPMYVRSIEKEYDVTILDQTRRRQHGGRQRRKPDYMSECA